MKNKTKKELRDILHAKCEREQFGGSEVPNSRTAEQRTATQRRSDTATLT